MDHVCEWEISRGGDVAFAAALGKILLLAVVVFLFFLLLLFFFVWLGLKAGPEGTSKVKTTPSILIMRHLLFFLNIFLLYI